MDDPFGLIAKVLVHGDRVAGWLRSGDTFPVSLEVNLTNVCNQACEWCISAYSHLANPNLDARERATRRADALRGPGIAGDARRLLGLDARVLGAFLDESKALGLKAVTWSGGGEPTVHPRFSEVVASAATMGIEQGLMTNGLFRSDILDIVATTLGWVRVSLDTINAAKYAEQKRTSGFSTVVRNIESLARRGARVGVNVNLAQWNSDEILSITRWASDVGATYIQFRPVLGLPFKLRSERYGSQLGNGWIEGLRPQLEEAEQYASGTFRVIVSWDKFRDLLDRSGHFGRRYRACRSHYFSCVLNANGDLTVCMYHLGDARFVFGNIYDAPVADIWGSSRRHEVLRFCAEDLDLETCQVCCKGHELNKLLHDAEGAHLSSDRVFL